MVPLKTKDTRCSLCSLGCFLRLSQSPLGYVTPDYRQDAPELRRGACNRGSMTAELLTHVLRLDSARLSDDKKPHDVPLDKAISVLADAVKSSDATLIIDGNLPGEDIAAALALAAGSGGKIIAGVHLPSEDQTALDGLAASKAKLLTPEELAECDAILIVGNAFATHPVISRPVHGLRKRNPRTPVVVIDSMPGRTAIFATHPLIVKPGTESRALGFIAGKIGAAKLKPLHVTVKQAASATGIADDALASAAGALGAAGKIGVILRPEIGKASNWEQIALLAGLIATEKGGGVTACLTYGNAVGAHRLMRAAGAASGRSGKPQATAIALGTDVVSGLSKTDAVTMLGGIKTLAAATPLPTPTLGAADVVLPLAFNFETGGTTVTGSGEVIVVDSVADAPGDATSAGELVMRLAEAMGITGIERKVDAKILGTMPEVDAEAIISQEQPEAPTASEGELILVMESDAVHFHMGSLTGRCAWPQYTAPTPVVAIRSAEADALGISDGETVKLTSIAGEGGATVRLVKEQPAGLAVVSSGFAEMRGLFPWERGTGPVAVRIEKA